MSAAIVIGNVTKRFGPRPALDGVSLEVAADEAVVILGPSGCGKTTLLRVIAGLEVPDEGDVWLSGRHVTRLTRVLVPPHQRGIGFVFQDLALWPHLTVRGNLDFVLQSRKIPRGSRRERIAGALALVRADGLADRHPHELSGGEQQRVALARALVAEPRVLLLDEPLSSLDPELRATLRGELARVRAALGVTSVYVTHDQEDAAALADRVVEMRAGRVVAVTDARPKEGRA